MTDKNKAVGYWGKMYFKGIEFDTLERAQGYVRLPLGAYDLQMYQSKKLGQVLRPLKDGKELAGKKSKIRIHAASLPSHIEGCIAPGHRSPRGSGIPMSGSRTAMTLLLLSSGSWENLKIVGSLFVIEDYTPPNERYTTHLLADNDAFSLSGLLRGL